MHTRRWMAGILGFLGLGLGVTAWQNGPQVLSWTAPVNLGPVVNTGSTDGCPYISKDGLSLYFASNRPGGMGGLDLYVAQRSEIDVPWGPPQNLTALNSTANELCPTLTDDRRYLLFVSDRVGGCGGQDLYVAGRGDKDDDQAWGGAANLGCTVNSPQNDFTPSYVWNPRTQTGSLYFSSNRPGGVGGTDIYVSLQSRDAALQAPAPVYELNTPFNDQRPNVRHDGLEIFFDSDRPGSSGPGDLWVSTRQTEFDYWDSPSNLGPVVNSTAMEGRPALSFTGKSLYFMSNRPASVPSPAGTPSIDLYVTTRRAPHAAASWTE